MIAFSDARKKCVYSVVLFESCNVLLLIEATSTVCESHKLCMCPCLSAYPFLSEDWSYTTVCLMWHQYTVLAELHHLVGCLKSWCSGRSGQLYIILHSCLASLDGNSSCSKYLLRCTACPPCGVHKRPQRLGKRLEWSPAYHSRMSDVRCSGGYVIIFFL